MNKKSNIYPGDKEINYNNFLSTICFLQIVYVKLTIFSQNQSASLDHASLPVPTRRNHEHYQVHILHLVVYALHIRVRD